MEETLFPPSPSWFLPNIIACREDGSVSYGSKNNIVILKLREHYKSEILIIQDAHSLRVTAVAFSPSNCKKSLQNTLVSSAEDGFIKLWNIDTLGPTIGHKCHWEQKGESGKVVSLDWSVANPCYIVSAADNNTIVLWDILSNSTTKFTFQKLGATVISCCPYNEKIVAVGGKTGQIYIIRLLGNGDVIYRLRGHDNNINSLSWCPVPYNIFNIEEINEEFLLASSCQNKEVFIWRVGSDGKCQIRFQIPTSALSDSQHHGKIGNSFNYTALCWLEPDKIYLSSNFGELIYFDIKLYAANKVTREVKLEQKKKKHLLNFFKVGHCFHTKGLYAIAGPLLKAEVALYKKMNIESELQIPLQSNNTKIIKMANENQFDRCKAWEVIIPESSSLLWTAGQDRKLIACKASNLSEMVFNYHTVNGFVYCSVVSPHDPNKIAIGVGDGMVRLWNVTEPFGDIQVYWQKIKDRVMSLSWHPTKDGLLAYGTSEGRIGLIDTKSNKLPNVFKPGHPQPIYSLSWGPKFCSEITESLILEKLEFDLYAVGDNTLSVYNPLKLNADPINLSKIIPFTCNKQTDVCWKPDYSLMAVGNLDGSICLIDPYGFKIMYTILAYKKLIQSIAWHPVSTSTDSGLSSFHGYFTSGSTDNDYEIRVFNCKKEDNELKVDLVAILKGHHGHIQSVSWCPHISGRLVSTSADGSVQIWDVLSQTPLVNFIPSGMPIFSIWSPIDPDFIFTGCKTDILCIWRTSNQTKVFPLANIKTRKSKKDKNIQMSVIKEIMTDETESTELTVPQKISELNIIAMAESKTAAKSLRESKMFVKLWKTDVDEELRNCYSLLKENNAQNYSLPFLCGDDDYFKKSIKAEEELCKKSNQWMDFCELSLWHGNIKEVLEERITNGQLNDFLVSLAPIISPRLWQEACLSYSNTLAEKKCYRKAASYLIVCHKIYEAIQLLTDANLYLEALCIARSRLPKSDPLFKDVVKKYGDWLFKNGSFLKACECYIYLEDYYEVAKVCGKKNQAEYLRLAALAAKKCGSRDLEVSEATNAVFKCFETKKLELCQQVCEDHSNLEHIGLICFIYNAIQSLEAKELVLKVDIISYIRESFETKNVVFPTTLPKLFHKYAFYKNKEEVFAIITQELSFAACSKTTEEVLSHVTKALSTCCRYIQGSGNEIHPLYELCLWLSPDGFLKNNSFFTLKSSSPKMKSIRAFLCSSVVRHLNDHQENENILHYLNLLNQLKEDLLDPDSYKYFQNLMEVEICEKRLLKNRSKISKKKLENGKIWENTSEKVIESEDRVHLKSNDDISTGTYQNEAFDLDSNASDISQEEIERRDKKFENNQNNTANLKTEIMDISHENEILRNLKSKLENCKSVEYECDSDLEEKITKDLDLLKKLKAEIESFEVIRISSPNPVPIYFMLKKLCEGVGKNECAIQLLKDLNEKWKELN